MAKTFTRAEVKRNNHNQSSWIVIHNNVYNVTEFLNEHPGGEEVLLEQAGGDGSEAFEDVGHSSDARELMKKYKIGEIVKSEHTHVEEKTEDWLSHKPESDTSANQSSLTTYLVPIIIGLCGLLVYYYYF